MTSYCRHNAAVLAPSHHRAGGSLQLTAYLDSHGAGHAWRDAGLSATERAQV